MSMKKSNEELVALIQGGVDVQDNLCQLWQQNQRFIGKIAMSYKGYEELDDLKQQGYIGLSKAVDRYNPDEGVPFINYAAFWIRQSMVRYIQDYGNTVRIPIHTQDKIREYKKLCSTFELYYGRKPLDYEMSYFLGVSEESIESIKKASVMAQIGSLDVPVGEDEECSMYDLLPGQESPEDDIVETIQQEQLRETLWNMVDDLPGQQAAVVRMRYQEGKTLQEISGQIGYCYQRAAQIQQQALRELRKPRRAKVLKSLVYDDVYANALSGNGVEHFNRTWTSSTERAAMKLAELESEELHETIRDAKRQQD